MEIVLGAEEMVVKLGVLEKIASVKFTDIRVPRKDVVRAEAAVPESSWRELRIPGTYFPGLIKAGSYSTPRGFEFWYVTKKRSPISINIANHTYARLIFGAANVDADAINQWAKPA